MSLPAPRSRHGRRAWTPRRIALAWGAAAFLATAALSSGPGISREEASVLAEVAAARGGAPAPRLRPPLPALLSHASEVAAVRFGLPHLTGYRLASALFSGILAALLALLAAELAGPAAAALAPALLFCAPRLLLPLVQTGPTAPAAALAVATVLAYRRAVLAPARSTRLAAAIATGVLFGLALAAQLEALALLAAVAVHASFVALGRHAEPEPAPELQRRPIDRGQSRCALTALAAMLVIGPATALALWPALWSDPVHGLQAALRAVPGDSPLVHLGTHLSGARPPWGLPLVVTALALPASLLLAFAGGLAHAVARLFAPHAAPGSRLSDLLVVLAALAPFAAAQAGLAARAPGPGPWLAAFPFLAALAARTMLAAAEGVWPARAEAVATALALATIAPGLITAVHAWPDLGASWGELAGGAPGAASIGLPRHDGAISPRLLAELSARARTGARVRFTGVSPAALAVYAADGRVRPDLTLVDSLDEAELAIVPASGGARQDEFRIWAALRTRAPVAGAFLDDVPLAWVYARPGGWR